MQLYLEQRASITITLCTAAPVSFVMPSFVPSFSVLSLANLAAPVEQTVSHLGLTQEDTPEGLLLLTVARLIFCSESTNTGSPFATWGRLFTASLPIYESFASLEQRNTDSDLRICARCWLSARFICYPNTIPLVLSDSWPGHAHPAPISIQLWLLCSPRWEHKLVCSGVRAACLMFPNVHLILFF